MAESRRSRRHDDKGNYIPQHTTSGGVLSGSGPYIARVVSVIDSTYMGTLQVELLKSASTGNQTDTEGQLYNVKYLSPFYGVTASYHNGKNERYEDTQQSYGFWAVPPDPGTRVVVIFVESDPSRGFWIGCVQDEYMNFMVPGGQPATAANASQRKLPVGEYNKLTDVVRGNDPTRYRKPVNTRFTDTLVEQGLFSDETRGLTTSSSRREVPSMVFGISTPGPVDKNTKPTEVGIRQAKGKYYASRLGGQSFVMDDGDDKLLRKGKAKNSPSEYANVEAGEQGGDIEVPHNELVRIRTRTGHQILLHNSEDLIYIGNSRGTSWIELTSNGKIDIYAKDSISIHTEEDLNFTADRDINFTAGQNINTVAGKEIRRSAGLSISQTSGTFISDNAGTRISRAATTAITDWAGGGGINLATQGAFQAASVQSMLLGSQAEVGIESCGSSFVKAGGCVNITAGESILETAAVDVGITASAGNTDITSGAEMHVKAGASIYNSTGTNYNIEAAGIIAQDAAEIYLNSGLSGSADTAETAYPPPGVSPAGPKQPVIPDPTARVPMHEPWLEHENLNPLNYTPDKTRAGTIQTPTEPILTPDTFAKSIGNASGSTPVNTSSGSTFSPNNANNSLADNTPISAPTTGPDDGLRGSPPSNSDEAETPSNESLIDDTDDARSSRTNAIGEEEQTQLSDPFESEIDGLWTYSSIDKAREDLIALEGPFSNPGDSFAVRFRDNSTGRIFIVASTPDGSRWQNRPYTIEEFERSVGGPESISSRTKSLDGIIRER